MLYFKIFSYSNRRESVISQGKYYTPSSLLNEILKEPDNTEEWSGVSVRPISVLSQKTKVKELLLLASYLLSIQVKKQTIF